jgi:hypothetical protein
MRATVYKADLWFRQSLQENPSDSDARWFLASIKLSHCSYGAESLLAPLARQDPGNLRWLVGASVLITCQIGIDQAPALRAELRELTAGSVIGFFLTDDAEDTGLNSALRIARRVLAGATILDIVEERAAGSASD